MRCIKIAIVNCYLAGGHIETAEVEACERLLSACSNLGISGKVFESNTTAFLWEPDLIILHSYQDGKLFDIPTFGTVTAPKEWMSLTPRFLQNLLSFDGYLSISDSTLDWLSSFAKANNKTLIPIHAAFSAEKTPFYTPNFANVYPVYIGTNWEHGRNAKLTEEIIRQRSKIKIFGPKKAWQNLPIEHYGGEIPFDGHSFLNVYNKAGIGLYLNNKQFDDEQIPTSRLFEIPASSALMIAPKNSLAQDIYGDACLYFDSENSIRQIVQEIDDLVSWVKSNKLKAIEMARQANFIFQENLSMEVYLKNIVNNVLGPKLKFSEPIKMNNTNLTYEQIQINSNYIAPKPHSNTSIIILAISRGIYSLNSVINSLITQSEKPAEVRLIVGPCYTSEEVDEATIQLEKIGCKFVCFPIEDSTRDIPLRLLDDEFLNNPKIKYLSILSTDALIYTNFIEKMEETWASILKSKITVGWIYGGMVEKSPDKKIFGPLFSDIYFASQSPRETSRLCQFTQLEGPLFEQYCMLLKQSSICYPKETLKNYLSITESLEELNYRSGKEIGALLAPYVLGETSMVEPAIPNAVFFKSKTEQKN